MKTEIVDRRKFDTDDGAEVVTINVSMRDRLRVVVEETATLTIQADKGHAEIEVYSGHFTLYG